VIAVGVGDVGRAVRGQTVLLKPPDENAGGRALILIGADVHSIADDARTAVQVCCGHDVAVVARVDARRIGLQAKIAANSIHEEGRYGNVLYTIWREGSDAGIIRGFTAKVRSKSRSRIVVINDAVVQHGEINATTLKS